MRFVHSQFVKTALRCFSCRKLPSAALHVVEFTFLCEFDYFRAHHLTHSCNLRHSARIDPRDQNSLVTRYVTPKKMFAVVVPIGSGSRFSGAAFSLQATSRR